MPSKSSARLAALTVAAVCSTVSAVVLTSPAARGRPCASTTSRAPPGLSPLAGQQVTDVAGIVTGVRTYGSSQGFWIQDPTPDADPATSEGVFVFTSSTPTVAVGDSVTVSGTVVEYVPGGASSGNQSVTRDHQADGHGRLQRQRASRPPTVVDAKSVPSRVRPGR